MRQPLLVALLIAVMVCAFGLASNVQYGIAQNETNFSDPIQSPTLQLPTEQPTTQPTGDPLENWTTYVAIAVVTGMLIAAVALFAVQKRKIKP